MKTLSRSRTLLRKSGSRLLEQLESRVLMSANVSASVSNGVLTIKGDNANDNITISQSGASATSFSLASGDGVTTINGQKTAAVFNGVSGIVISTGAGNDTVTLQNASVNANIQITGTAGNQFVTLNNVTVGGNFTLTNGGGQNNTLVENSQIQGSISVNVGAGFNGQCGNFWCCQAFSNANEIFTLNSVTVGNNVSVTNVSGETTTTIDTSTIDGSLTVNNGGSSYGSCGFNLGCGHCGSGYSTAGDLFTMTTSNVNNNVTISNASDGNNTDFENSSVFGNVSVSNDIVSNGGCGFSLCGGGNYATASDAFTFKGGSVGGNLNLANVSDGATATLDDASINGTLTINNGVGTYGQGCCICAGSTTANGADSLSVAISSIGGNVSISNGSTYNATVFDSSTLIGSISVSDGLSLCTPSGGCYIQCCCGGKDYSGVYTTDLFTLTGTTVIGGVNVTNASGYTDTTIDSSTIILNVTVTDSSGTNYFTMDNASVIVGNLSFVAGQGVTNVTVSDDSLVVGNATVTVSRDATVSIDASQSVDGTFVVN